MAIYSDDLTYTLVCLLGSTYVDLRLTQADTYTAPIKRNEMVMAK